MDHAADPSHPRYDSLLKRQLLEEAAKAGMLADSALIAHGRGEAFDYLLGERTCLSAALATAEVAARLAAAQNPIISFNGNAVALAADDLLRCAAVLGCPVEVNIFYRTAERMQALLDHLRARLEFISTEGKPDAWSGDWAAACTGVKILGANPNGKIPGLKGNRANCETNGILAADVILVPLEDGDRCEALVNMEKDVLVVDLNPLSRSAMMASVTVVDELTRMAANLLATLVAGTGGPDLGWDNRGILQAALDEMGGLMRSKFS